MESKIDNTQVSETFRDSFDTKVAFIMQDSDQEIVRQALSSILDRLNGGAGGANEKPIILVVMGQPNARGESADSREKERGNAASTVHPPDAENGFDRRAVQATHPVFERFQTAEAGTGSPAPKTCFMEPGRVCVNSGACEMRGY